MAVASNAAALTLQPAAHIRSEKPHAEAFQCSPATCFDAQIGEPLC
jgi:hypothetical protein